MIRLSTRFLGLLGVLALVLAVGAFSQAPPVSATSPINSHNYPDVLGVDGSSMSIAAMNLSPAAVVMNRIDLSPWAGAAENVAITEWRISDMRRNDKVQIEGQYCQAKNGEDVFIAKGAPVPDWLTCGTAQGPGY